jgi:hypothetical protein
MYSSSSAFALYIERFAYYCSFYFAPCSNSDFGCKDDMYALCNNSKNIWPRPRPRPNIIRNPSTVTVQYRVHTDCSLNIYNCLCSKNDTYAYIITKKTFTYLHFSFLYSPYPSPVAQSPSKCFTGCSLPARGIQWCAHTHCTARFVSDCVTPSNYGLLPQDTPPQINAKNCLTITAANQLPTRLK